MGLAQNLVTPPSFSFLGNMIAIKWHCCIVYGVEEEDIHSEG
jgi:hypothetical protein